PSAGGRLREKDQTPPSQSHSVDHRGLPVLVKPLWRSRQKICHPKSSCSFPLAREPEEELLQVLHASSDFCWIFPYS
ncbi:hypothetical protein HGM15179_016837, partial [Zosterops borbonicus]